MELRPIRAADAPQLWDMMNRLDVETKCMLYEPGERRQQSNGLNDLKHKIDENLESGDFFWVAEVKGRIAGYILAERGKQRRVRHSAYIVIGILADYRNMGLGSEFFRRLEKWAIQEKIVRLELTVECVNTAAVCLYERKGFVIEGVRRKSMYVDGEYIDEYYMARMVGEPVLRCKTEE